jgi:hypothetical protein
LPPVPAARGIARTSEGGGEIHPGSGLRQIDRSRWMGMAPAGWVAGLVAESFFVACPAHESRKKNERNIFCLACCASICPHCGPAHRHHPLLQVSLVSSPGLLPLPPLRLLFLFSSPSHAMPWRAPAARHYYLYREMIVLYRLSLLRMIGPSAQILVLLPTRSSNSRCCSPLLVGLTPPGAGQGRRQSFWASVLVHGWEREYQSINFFIYSPPHADASSRRVSAWHGCVSALLFCRVPSFHALFFPS